MFRAIKRKLRAGWQWFTRRTGVTQEHLPDLNGEVVLSLPEYAAQMVCGIAVSREGDRLVVVCERSLLDHQVEWFESFSGLARNHTDFVFDTDRYADIRPHIKALRRKYYGPVNEERIKRAEREIGCYNDTYIEPNLEPRPTLSPTCPRLDQCLVDQMVSWQIEKRRMLPVERAGDRLVLVCERPLTTEEVGSIEFSHNRKFEFVWDPNCYPEVCAHFDELIAYYTWEPYVEQGFLGVIG